MHKIIYSVTFIFLFPFFAFSQSEELIEIIGNIVLDTDFTYQQINAEQYKFTFHTFFTMGSPGNCIPVQSTAVYIENDTLKAEIYYDFTGALQAQGCDRYDDTYFNQAIPANVTTIKMSTNVISPELEDAETLVAIKDLYVEYFPLGVMGTVMQKLKEVQVYPNPADELITYRANELLVNKVLLYNSLGQPLSVMVNSDSSLLVKTLPNGFYYLAFLDADNKPLVTKKVVIQH